MRYQLRYIPIARKRVQSYENILNYQNFFVLLHTKLTYMKKLLLIAMCVLMSVTTVAQHIILVEKGSVQSLLDAIGEANRLNAETNAPRTFILIPDGLYDLGDRVLTRISGHNIAIVGQSMRGTVIQNCPDVRTESISKTAVFQNRGNNNYFQDLTLKNALDYYLAVPDGRAVTLQDKGTRTICNRVCMLSYQDTYYSDNERCQSYMYDTEIHGTIDFICGAGDVWFERCRIVTEKRNRDGSGINIITATRTSETLWGYVFNRCTVENDVSMFNFGRSWHTNPHCVWLYTTLLTPEKLEATRFDDEGMKVSGNYFKEYGTMDAEGRDITPSTNVVTFTLRDHTQPFTAETIMTREEAKLYTLKNVFTDWHPARELRKLENRSKRLKKVYKLY